MLPLQSSIRVTYIVEENVAYNATTTKASTPADSCTCRTAPGTVPQTTWHSTPRGKNKRQCDVSTRLVVSVLLWDASLQSQNKNTCRGFLILAMIESYDLNNISGLDQCVRSRKGSGTPNMCLQTHEFYLLVPSTLSIIDICLLLKKRKASQKCS